MNVVVGFGDQQVTPPKKKPDDGYHGDRMILIAVAVIAGGAGIGASMAEKHPARGAMIGTVLGVVVAVPTAAVLSGWAP